MPHRPTALPIWLKAIPKKYRYGITRGNNDCADWLVRSRNSTASVILQVPTHEPGRSDRLHVVRELAQEPPVASASQVRETNAFLAAVLPYDGSQVVQIFACLPRASALHKVKAHRLVVDGVLKRYIPFALSFTGSGASLDVDEGICGQSNQWDKTLRVLNAQRMIYEDIRENGMPGPFNHMKDKNGEAGHSTSNS